MDASSPCWMARRGFRPCHPAKETDMVLDIPDYRQDTEWGCGETAARCVLAYHRIVTPYPRVSSPVDGIDPVALERVFRKLHLRVSAGNYRVDDLQEFCNSRRPPIALVRWPGSSDSHWIVVRGVSRGRVWFHDVESGPGKCRLQEWQSAWSADDGRLPFVYRAWAVVAWPAE